MFQVSTLSRNDFGQVPFDVAFERAQRAAPLLRNLATKLRREAGPQRLLTFPDLDPAAPPVPTEFNANARAEFIQNRDALAAAIREINPAIDEFELARRGAFPRVPPEAPTESQNVDTFAGQIDALLSVYNEIVLGKKPIFGASPVVIIGGLALGFVVFGAIVYWTRR